LRRQWKAGAKQVQGTFHIATRSNNNGGKTQVSSTQTGTFAKRSNARLYFQPKLYIVMVGKLRFPSRMQLADMFCMTVLAE